MPPPEPSLGLIQSSVAATWRAWVAGPPESRIRPSSRTLRAPLWLAWQYRLRGRSTLTRLVARAFGGGEVVLSTEWGGTLVTPPSDTYFLRGVCSEPFETAVVARLVRPGMVALDIGANRGWYTVLLSRLVGPGGVVHAFEPDRAALAQLHRNVARNPFCTNVQVHEVAVSDSSGDALFWARNDTLVSRLLDTVDSPTGPSSDATHYRVGTIRLDDFLVSRSVDRVDFIKCDVEGAEAHVIEGLLPAIDRGMRPILLLECIEANLRKYGAHLGDLPRRLNPFGHRRYRCLPLCGAHGQPEPLDGSVCPQALNMLCLPEESADRILTRVFVAPSAGSVT